MKIYRTILLGFLSLLLSACIGGIDTGGGGGGGDVGAPTLQIASGDSQIVLGWIPNPDFGPPDNYVLNYEGVGIFEGDATAYVDTPVTNGLRRCYTVSAVAGENVATSAERCATPMAGTVLTALNQSLSVVWNWDAVPGAASYNLYFQDPIPSPSLSKGMTKATGDDPINVVGTTYTSTGLSNWCITYPLEIRPVDIDGNEGVASTQDGSPDTEGILDTTFGDSGLVTVVGATNGTFYGLAVLEDDTIVGLVDGDNTILIGYPDDVDATKTPLWEISFEATMDTARAMAVDANENIYVAGSDSGNAKVCRFVPDASGYVLDTGGFGTGGCYEYVTGDSTQANAIALDSQGRIILAGQTGPLLGWEITLWRIAADGSGLDGWPGTLPLRVNGQGFQLAGDNWSYATGVTMLLNASDDKRLLFSIAKENGAGVLGGYYYDIDEEWTTENSLNLTPISGGVTDVVSLSDYNALTLLYDTAAIPGVYIQDVEVDPIKVNDTFFYDEDPANDEIANKIALDCHDRALVTGNATATGEIMIFRSDVNYAIDLGFATNGWYIFTNPAGTGGDGRVIAFDRLGRIIFGGTVDGAATTTPTLIRLQ